MHYEIQYTLKTTAVRLALSNGSNVERKQTDTCMINTHTKFSLKLKFTH